MTQCMTIFLDAKSPIQVETCRSYHWFYSVFPRVGKAGLTDAQHRLKLGTLHTSAACISVNFIICHWRRVFSPFWLPCSSAY